MHRYRRGYLRGSRPRLRERLLNGGAEALAESLHRELLARGFESALVAVPFAWVPRLEIVESALLWRLLSLDGPGGEPDLVIGTRFPSSVMDADTNGSSRQSRSHSSLASGVTSSVQQMSAAGSASTLAPAGTEHWKSWSANAGR